MLSTIKQRLSSQNSTEPHPYASLLYELKELKDELKELEQLSALKLQHVNPRHFSDALNLVHCLGLMRRDMRSLQKRLATIGISALDRMESQVLAHLNTITDLLSSAQSKGSIDAINLPAPDAISLEQLENNTNNLFGKPPPHRRARIMVTLPNETADDYSLIKDMLIHGVDCTRIDCAHGTPGTWIRMIDKIGRARRETGMECRILMDLGGPKLRTGELAQGPAVLEWRPQRNIYGKVTAPARIWLYPEAGGCSIPDNADACLPVRGDWLTKVRLHDIIELTDASGSIRALRITDQLGIGFWAESTQTTELASGMKLKLLRISTSGHARWARSTGTVGELPPLPESIRLHAGDSLIISREPYPGVPAQFDANGHLLQPACISCAIPTSFLTIQPGERILIDDGKIGGVIRSVTAGKIVVEITQAREGGEKLLANKSISLPDSRLEPDGLTPQDIEHLEFIAQHADMVALSSTGKSADIQLLQKHLKQLKAEKLGIVLKIGTLATFKHLPELLFTLLQSSNVGVMIARDYLAMECGHERLAGLQEEILRLTKGARLPVIWENQIMEGLSKNGKTSCAETFDAASEHAECVMLNRGATQIIKAIQSLNDALHRKQSFRRKRALLLRHSHC